jgi:hypothetical protein
METKQWGSFLLSGLLVSGNFIMTAPFIKQGKPFTDLPAKFKGWYKYTPANGDSAGIVALLTKFNTVSGKRDTIGIAVVVVTANVSVYTQFDLDFDYSITGQNPDSIIVVFASSADGANFNGQVGSTLFIDDVVLEYSTGLQESLTPESAIEVFPSPASDKLCLNFGNAIPGELICNIYSMDGRCMQTFSPSENNYEILVSTWPQGNYIVQAWLNGSLVSSSKFAIQR